MSTRCKFRCNSARKYLGYNNGPKFMYEYEFMAVTGDSEENKSFFASTPSGSAKFSVVRDDVFEPGKDYYFDITLAVAPEESAPVAG